MIYPIGKQNFENLRNEGFVYIDKSALIYKLVKEGSVYFLSRPRRFGKSLLLSTLEAYFTGKKELFKGLAIEQLEKDWFEYPVLHLDLNAEKYSNIDELKNILSTYLRQWEEEYGSKEADNTSLSQRFRAVIRAAKLKTGRNAVVLIDEHSASILGVLRFDVIKPTRADVFFEFFHARLGNRFGRRVCGKQLAANKVDACIGALCRKTPHNKQFPRLAAPFEGAKRLGIYLFECFDDKCQALLFLLLCHTYPLWDFVDDSIAYLRGAKEHVSGRLGMVVEVKSPKKKGTNRNS